MPIRLIRVGLAVAGVSIGAASAQTRSTSNGDQPAAMAPGDTGPAKDTTTGVGGPSGTRNALGNGTTTGAGMTGTGMPGQGNLPSRAPADANPNRPDAQASARNGAAETNASTQSISR